MKQVLMLNVESRILGSNPEFGINKVSLTQFRVEGRLIGSLEEGNIRTNEFVSGLKP